MKKYKTSIFNRATGKNWYSISNKTDIAEVMIYDEIGAWGIEASHFVNDVKKIDAQQINVHINTPGGDVFDGIAIFNALKDHKANIEVSIDSLAASIGSIIALSGDTVKMAKNAYFMIHNPWGMSIGGADEMRKTADLLDKIQGTLVDTYADRVEAEKEQIVAWMDDETWFTAQEALDAGFIDEITGEAKIKAKFDLTVFAKAPECLSCEASEKPPENIREFEAFLRDSGFSRSQSIEIASGGFGQRDSDTIDYSLLQKLIKEMEI